MSSDGLKDLVYLSVESEIPKYLTDLRGIRWMWAQSPEKLKQILKGKQGEVLVIIRSQYLSTRVVEAFLSWAQVKAKLSFIFIAQSIDNAVYQLTLNHPKALVLRETDGGMITSIVTRCLNGMSLKSRRQERLPVESPVMLKKFNLDPASPTGAGMQFLREGDMRDFSQGGALIQVKDGQIETKDFVSLMYQDQNGKWVSIESQVRWVAMSPLGQQIIGVQFLATA